MFGPGAGRFDVVAGGGLCLACTSYLMKSLKFRVCFFGGCGVAQTFHIPGWKNLPEVEIVGIADVSEETARKAADAAGGARTFSDYRDLLKLDLDAVDICTPNKVH